MKNVQDVARRGICSGCGVCAGVAPCNTLSMELTPDGEYQPRADACSDCGVCLSVCPMVNQPVQLVLGDPLGKSLATFVGYSQVNEERLQGSSGGMVTHVLKALIERHWVDGVVTIVATGQRVPLFAPAVLRTQAQISAAARSKYYPVEFSQVLREIKEMEGRFALVGLPCVITGLRLCQQRFPWLEVRLRFLLGLTCGHTVSTRYTDFLAYCSGVMPDRVQHVEYRIKAGTKSASDYTFEATDTGGRPGRRLGFQSAGWVDLLWGNGLLTPLACFRCVDTFAAQADASFMDAWLPEYAADPRGHSLVVVRNQQLLTLLSEERRSGRIVLEPIPPERVLASQRGLLARKTVVAELVSSAGRANSLRLRALQLRLWYWRCRSQLSKVVFRLGGTVGYRFIQCWLRFWMLRRYTRGVLVKLARPAVRAVRRAAKWLRRHKEEFACVW